jgi:hypothetical protein
MLPPILLLRKPSANRIDPLHSPDNPTAEHSLVHHKSPNDQTAFFEPGLC